MNDNADTTRRSVLWGVSSIVCSVLACAAFWFWGSYSQAPSEEPSWQAAKRVFRLAQLGFPAAGLICVLVSWKSAEPRWLVAAAFMLNMLPMSVIAIGIWLATSSW
jgi:hypothetical protein